MPCAARNESSAAALSGAGAVKVSTSSFDKCAPYSAERGSETASTLASSAGRLDCATANVSSSSPSACANCVQPAGVLVSRSVSNLVSEARVAEEARAKVMRRIGYGDEGAYKLMIAFEPSS